MAEQPIACPKCGSTNVERRADRTLKMHFRPRRPGELRGVVPWCEGGLPPAAGGPLPPREPEESGGGFPPAMKALTVRQPWAWAIAQGAKTIENRTWNTTHRGRLAIHAAARPDREEAFTRVCELTGAYVLKSPASAIVAVVDVVSVCTTRDCGCGPWAIPGQLHWRLANARALPDPVPCKGRLGLWDLTPKDSLRPSDVEAAVRAQLGALVSPGR